MRWLRWLLWRRGGELGHAAAGRTARDGRPSIAGFRPEEGPFDRPPAEPVDLDPRTLPPELRDDEER